MPGTVAEVHGPVVDIAREELPALRMHHEPNHGTLPDAAFPANRAPSVSDYSGKNRMISPL